MSESTWNDPRITAYVLGELTDDDRSDFESELESNGELAAAVDEARSVTGQLQDLYATEPTRVLDSERRDAIAAGETLQIHRQDNPRSWKVPTLLLATAAALLLLVGIAPLLRQQEHEAILSQNENAQEMDSLSRQPDQDESQSAIAEQLAEVSAVEMADAELAEVEAAEMAPVTKTLETSVQLPIVKFANEPQQRAAEVKSLGKVESAITPAPAPASEPTRLSIAEPAPSPSNAPYSQLEAPRSKSMRRRSGDVAGQSADQPTSEKDRAWMAARTESLGFADAEGDDSSGDDSPGDDSPGDRRQSQPQPQQPQELGAKVAIGSKRDMKEVLDVSRKGLQKSSLLESESKSVEDFRFQQGGGERGSAQPSGQAEKKLAEPRFAQPLAAGPAIRGRLAEAGREQLPQQAADGFGRGGIGGGGFGGGGAAADDNFSHAIDEGRGPGVSGDRFEPITDNAFKRVSEEPISTFSVDVDTASYSKTRDFLTRANQLPRPDAVRIEELVNYFDYEYDPPSADDKHPFAARATVTACPWNKEHRLARIALKGKTMNKDERPPCNLVFLLDTSGSMNAPNKLPLVIEGMQMLLKQLNKDDKVAVTVYAGSAGLVLDSTSAKKSKKIRKALTELQAGGSTNGGAGIALAYQTARDNFITEGVNRVILCTDGDFNVGTTGTDELVRMVEREAKGGVFLSVLGFGMGNHNDSMLEKISGRGNGNYAFIDHQLEARKVLVDQTSGTLVTIAKDVKLQIEFNLKHVSSYRLIGYENRVLAKEDFNDDKKDAGEIGAGHAVTAFYEIVPAGVDADASQPKVDALKYQTERKPTEASDSDEMMTLKLRYKEPDGDTSTLVEFPVSDEGGKFKDADHDVRFAAAVASFGMQLRRSEYAGLWTLSDVMKVADDSKGEDIYGLRAEFVELVRKASELMGQQ